MAITQHNNPSISIISTDHIKVQKPKDPSYYLATPSQRAWFASGCTTLLIALAKLVSMIARSPNVPQTFLETLLAAFLGYILSDFVSGIYHWALDNYGTTETPIFGPSIEEFLSHHHDPLEITKCEVASVLYVFGGIVTAVVMPLNIFSDDHVAVAFVAVLGGFVMFGLQIHSWSHMARADVPVVIVAMQDAGVILRWSKHKAHHRPPYHANYCAVSGVWNRVLDKYRFFQGMEAVVFYVLGVRARSWIELNKSKG